MKDTGNSNNGLFLDALSDDDQALFFPILPILIFALMQHLLGELALWKVGISSLFAAGVYVYLKPWRFASYHRHILPFAAWMGLLFSTGESAGWKYAIIAVICAGLFLFLRPWRTYRPLQVQHVLPSVAVGVLVFAVWVVMESPLLSALPAVQDAYLRYAVMPFGSLPDVPDIYPYDPAVAGWPLSLMRLAGSAFVIAVIEEFFWRGFLYRWMLKKEFVQAEPLFQMTAFVLVSVCFGFEHNRWLVGIFAGLAYGWLYIKTRDLWSAALAHVLTNLILGVYALATQQYAFW